MSLGSLRKTGITIRSRAMRVCDFHFILATVNYSQSNFRSWQSYSQSAAEGVCRGSLPPIGNNCWTTYKGLHPSAQGCEERATLGHHRKKRPNPEGVASHWERAGPQPLHPDISHLVVWPR